LLVSLVGVGPLLFPAGCGGVTDVGTNPDSLDEVLSRTDGSPNTEAGPRKDAGSGDGGIKRDASAPFDAGCKLARTDLPSLPGACQSCLEKSCCSEVNVCFSNADCNALIDCEQRCQSEQCFDGCVQAHPAGEKLLTIAGECVDKLCQRECN